MSDIDKLLAYESKKKSGLIAALLNFFLPGVGYMYCHNFLLGMIAFAIAVILFFGTFGVGMFFFMPILLIDGVLCASRYNKKLAKKMSSNGLINPSL